MDNQEKLPIPILRKRTVEVVDFTPELRDMLADFYDHILKYGRSASINSRHEIINQFEREFIFNIMKSNDIAQLNSELLNLRIGNDI